MGSAVDPREGPTVAYLSGGEWILSAICGFHRSLELLSESMNELRVHRVSLESHKDKLVLCNLVCGAQVLVHVSTRGKTKV